MFIKFVFLNMQSRRVSICNPVSCHLKQVCFYSIQYARLGSVISIFAQVNGPVAQRTVTIRAVAKEKKQKEARKA
jgi:hypothetical protein